MRWEVGTARMQFTEVEARLSDGALCPPYGIAKSSTLADAADAPLPAAAQPPQPQRHSLRSLCILGPSLCGPAAAAASAAAAGTAAEPGSRRLPIEHIEVAGLTSAISPSVTSPAAGRSRDGIGHQHGCGGCAPPATRMRCRGQGPLPSSLSFEACFACGITGSPCLQRMLTPVTLFVRLALPPYGRAPGGSPQFAVAIGHLPKLRIRCAVRKTLKSRPVLPMTRYI
jgi:hypothetical protein